MRQKNKRLIVSFNSDGEEALASEKTLHDVCDLLVSSYDVLLIGLNSKDWLNKTIKLIDKDKSPWFIAHHGGFGENGELLSILELNNISHTHSRSCSCAVFIDKHKTKLIYKFLSIDTPNWFFSDVYYGSIQKEKSLVKKPIYGGSKKNISLVKSDNNFIKSGRDFVYESMIDGDLEMSVGVIGKGEKTIALLPVTRKRNIDDIGNLHDYSGKIKQSLLVQAQCLAKKIHQSLNCCGVTKTDFLIDKNGKLWAIETDAMPSLAIGSAVSRGAEKIGISYRQLISGIIKNSYENKK